MRETLTTIGELLGLGVAAVGVGMLSVPVGIIAGGLAFVGVCALVARK